MTHTNKDGKPKLVKNLTYPLTAAKCVNFIITDVAVIEVTDQVDLSLRSLPPDGPLMRSNP